MARVLVVAAHPDDELLGVGGTILRHLIEGDEVQVHIECVRDLRDGDARLETAREVAVKAGYTLTLGTSPQLGYEVPDLGVIRADVVYTHHAGDLNRDHRLVAEAVFVAARQVPTIRTFETLSSTEWGQPFNPTYYVGIDLAAKLDLLSRYASELRQFPHPRSPEAVRALAAFRGSTAGLAAAEAFQTVRDRW